MTKRKRGFPTPVASLLAAAFRGKPLEKRLEEAGIWRVWDETVGVQIATKARPSRFQDGVLTVLVNSAPWMQQLNFMKRDIAQRLNEHLGKELVREIYLKAGRPVATEQPVKTKKPEKRDLSAEEKESITAAVAAIDDPELRRVFADLLEKHVSHQPDKK
jgi:predicted nucleic acid-binding Zn ribbon protein